MKRIFQFCVVLALLTLMPLNVNAQCKGFAKRLCKVELDPFIHDGNYHAAILTTGEEAELYKTFYSETNYRITVCGADNMPEIEFRVIDSDRNVLYSNESSDFYGSWDFRLEASQQLKIFVRVPVNENMPDQVESGCVAIMFGFQED